MQLVNKLDCLVTHEEADITLCSYMLKAAASNAETVRIVCDDTDVFVLLVYMEEDYQEKHPDGEVGRHGA